MRKSTFQHMALINSSFSVFFVIAAVIWATILAKQFPESMEKQVTLIVAMFAFTAYIFGYIIRQFYEATTVLRLILLYLWISAFGGLISAIVGPLSEETVPVIRILFIGPTVAVGAGEALVTASVILFYGVVVLTLANISAIVAELAYIRLLPLVPKRFIKLMLRFDSMLDNRAVRISDKYFFTDQKKGIFASVIIMMMYVFIYLIATAV